MKKLLLKLQKNKWLKDQFKSIKLRSFFLKEYDIDVGLYSYGCFDENRIARGTKIGRYCSFAPTCYIFNGNHGINFLSLHPYAYNPSLGFVKSETIVRNKCVVSDDVWIGHNAIITPNVSMIGRGAVIAAGAVVTKNVPAYAIVAGNPARIIKYRFSPEIIESIEATKWWLEDDANFNKLLTDNPNLFFNPSDYFNKNQIK